MDTERIRGIIEDQANLYMGRGGEDLDGCAAHKFSIRLAALVAEATTPIRPGAEHGVVYRSRQVRYSLFVAGCAISLASALLAAAGYDADADEIIIDWAKAREMVETTVNC